MPKYTPNATVLEPIEFTFCGKEFKIARVTQEFMDRIAEFNTTEGSKAKISELVKVIVDSAEGPDFDQVKDFDIREFRALMNWLMTEALAIPDKEKNAGDASVAS